MLVTTDAVLLRAHPYSESSLVLRFLTQDLGVVRAMVRGVRRAGGKGVSPPATFDRGGLEVSYRENRELQTLRSFAVEASGRRLGSHVLPFTGASLLAELVLAAPSEEPSAELYGALAGALDRLAEGKEGDGVVGEIFAGAWAILGALGYAPSVDDCVRCGEPLEDDAVARFDASAGGLRCPACATEAAGGRVGPGARSELRALLRSEAPARLRKPSGHLRLLEAFALDHLELSKPLSSAGMLRGLLTSSQDVT